MTSTVRCNPSIYVAALFQRRSMACGTRKASERVVSTKIFVNITSETKTGSDEPFRLRVFLGSVSGEPLIVRY
jgi:hypothetical protein